jgi:hypothetical protein
MRALDKSECEELENLKLHVLSNIVPLSVVSVADIQKVIGSTKKMPKALADSMRKSNVNLANLNIENFRRQAISCYIQYILDR